MDEVKTDDAFKRQPKSRASRESRQMDEVGDDESRQMSPDGAPKRQPKSRASRESVQMEDDGYFQSNGGDVDENAETDEDDEAPGPVSMVNGPPKRKAREARGSMVLDD